LSNEKIKKTIHLKGMNAAIETNGF